MFVVCFTSNSTNI